MIRCGRIVFPRFRLTSEVILLLALFVSGAFAQAILLDDFESLTGWKPIMSEGAKLNLMQGEGKEGRAMVMEFDLSGAYGYVIAQKEFALDLPTNYQFTFDMRGETPVNNFEFKLMDEDDNVFWIKKLNIEYPKVWTKERIKKRHLSFAWGPNRGRDLRKVRKIEFAVSCGSGGKGKVYIDNFRFEAIGDTAGKNARAEAVASSFAVGYSPVIDPAGSVLTGWRSNGTAEKESLTLNFKRLKEIGGLVIDWDSADYAKSYTVLLSDDGNEWSTGYTVSNGNGGRDYVPLFDGQGRLLRIDLDASSRGKGYAIERVAIKDPQFTSSTNALFRAMAADAPPGYYPKYLQNKQSYWTVLGVNGDTKEALMNEQGEIEVDKLQFSLEPFLYIDGKLVTWSDVTTTPALLDGYLPIPSVTWRYKNQWVVTIEGVAAGIPGNSLIGMKYSVQSNVSNGRAKFFVAIRPFQVNPPWQTLNIEGGTTRIDSIFNDRGMIEVNDIKVIPMTPPTAFGAAEFDQGHITDYLARGTVPPAQAVRDHFGYASAALEYDLLLQPEQIGEIVIAVPFHGWRKSPVPNMGGGGDRVYYDLMRVQTADQWRRKLNGVQFILPPSAQAVVNTIKSNLAYIFINRDGPGIQPGSRTYERSWIRDGSLTCSALLRMGHPEEVREFIDWYAKGQFPSGKIPCVIDERGPDPLPEHDSNGEFIYAVLQYFQFTKDTLWLRGKFDNIVRTVRYIQALRAERKTDTYRNGTPEQRACYGLVPESISHEGYSDVPRHSYWDDFFILRGLKDATRIAGILGEKKVAKDFAMERDDFRKDLYTSMRLVMKNKHINYIPGCVELGDFDATSTTIGVSPGGELGNIPEPQLHYTFDRYYKYFVKREKDSTIVNYTPYETRVIGTFVLLGQKKRAEEALNFFMNDRRPAAWNEWAEVVWRDPSTPKYIGDMPHTWVGSDFIRSVRSMFVYEREKDQSLVVAAGIPDAWVNDPTGIEVQNLPTYYGLLNYTMRKTNHRVSVDLSGAVHVPPGGILLTSPLEAKTKTVTVNGKKVSPNASREVRIKALPAEVEFLYGTGDESR